MKKIRLYSQGLFLAWLTLLSGQAISTSLPEKSISPAAVVGSEKQASLIFMLYAAKADIIKNGDSYELILQETSPNVVYFGDRPLRQAGFLTMSTFVKYWNQNDAIFKKEPPNVAIMGTDSKGASKEITVKLFNPLLLSKNSLKFKVTVAGGKMKLGNYNNISIFMVPGYVLMHKVKPRLILYWEI